MLRCGKINVGMTDRMIMRGAGRADPVAAVSSGKIIFDIAGIKSEVALVTLYIFSEPIITRGLTYGRQHKKDRRKPVPVPGGHK